MSRPTIDLTTQHHQALKAMATLKGKTLKQYALDRIFPNSLGEDHACYELKTLLQGRLAEAERGEVEAGSITDIAMTALRARKVCVKP